MVAEIAHSSRAIDLHLKKERYAVARVLEYIVLCAEPERFYCFDLLNERELAAAADGAFRSIVFLGLWIAEAALLKLDYVRTMDTLRQGMTTSAYKEFAAKLARRI